jgi:hypothetical protein
MSDLVKKRLAENPRDKMYEMATIKLHDHAGNWADENDSAYVGRARLANGGLFMSNSEFIAKQFEQQFVLTTHELDRKTLKAKWDSSYEKYNIV